MSIPVLIDEQRVIALHNSGLPCHIIAQRFDCGAYRIRQILIRHGISPRVNPSAVGTLGGGAVRRYGHRAGLGD